MITRFFKQFVKHALGCLDQTLVCCTGDVVFLKTTGQCTGAAVKVSESLCQFVQVPRLVLVSASDRFQRPVTGSGTRTRRERSAWT